MAEKGEWIKVYVDIDTLQTLYEAASEELARLDDVYDVYNDSYWYQSLKSAVEEAKRLLSLAQMQ